MRPKGVTFIAQLNKQGKEIIGGILLVVIAFFIVNILAAEFNVSGTTQIVLNIAPTMLALGLLLKYLDVF